MRKRGNPLAIRYFSVVPYLLGDRAVKYSLTPRETHETRIPDNPSDDYLREAMASLLAIAHASGGRYITAGSAEELKEALASTVGTSFRVFKGSTEIANGSLGSEEPLQTMTY